MARGILEHLLLLVIVITGDEVRQVCTKVPSELHDESEQSHTHSVAEGGLLVVAFGCCLRILLVHAVADHLLCHKLDGLLLIARTQLVGEVAHRIHELSLVAHSRVPEDRQCHGCPGPIQLHSGEEGVLVGLLRLVEEDSGILLGTLVCLLFGVAVLDVSGLLGLVHRLGSDGHCQGIHEGVRGHTQTACGLDDVRPPHLPIGIRLHKASITGLPALPTLLEAREFLHSPVPALPRSCKALAQFYRSGIRYEGRHGEQLLDCGIDTEGNLRSGHTLGDVHGSTVDTVLGHGRMVHTGCNLRALAEVLPDDGACAVDTGHVLHLVAELLIGEQRVEVAVERCECRPVFHLLQVLDDHRECVAPKHIQCKAVPSTLDDGAGDGGRGSAVHVRSTHIHLTHAGIGQNLEREVVVDSSHRRTEHLLVHLVVLVADVHEELLLEPVGKFNESRVHLGLDCLHVLFLDTHTTEFHPAVGHLVHHVYVEQIALRQLVVLHLAAVPELHVHGGHPSLHRVEVRPTHLPSENIGHFIVKHLGGLLESLELRVIGIYPSAHEVVPEVAFSVDGFAAEVTEHLVEGGKRLEEEPQEAVVGKAVVLVAVLVILAAFEVGVGVVVNLLHAGLLCLTEGSATGDAVVEHLGETVNQFVVGFDSLHPVLTQSLLGGFHKLAVGSRSHLTGTPVFRCLTEFVLDTLLLVDGRLDVLNVFAGHLETGQFVTGCGLDGIVAAVQTLLCGCYMLVDGFEGHIHSILEDLHGPLAWSIQFALHLNALGIHLGAANLEQAVEHALGVTELVGHHQIHDSVNGSLEVLATGGPTGDGEHLLNLLAGNVGECTVVEQFFGKVGDGADGLAVVLPLGRCGHAHLGQILVNRTHPCVEFRTGLVVLLGHLHTAFLNYLIHRTGKFAPMNFCTLCKQFFAGIVGFLNIFQ